jgi:hypothetical protein
MRSARSINKDNQQREKMLTMKTEKPKALGSVPIMPNGQTQRFRSVSGALG